MGERKVLNKYFPPDFDPENIPKRKRPKDGQIKVRVMLPFTCQCQTCGEFIYRGRKFTSRQEFAPEKYLTIPIFRFYIKCPACCAEITFKTDPEHADYVCELGATRHFEPWRPDDARLELFKKPENKAEVGDSMLQLENRTKDSKREMDILDALEEIKEMNARHTKLSIEQLIAAKKKRVQEKANEEDEEIIQQTFRQQLTTIKRLDEDDEEVQIKKEKSLKVEKEENLKKPGYEENTQIKKDETESSPKKLEKDEESTGDEPVKEEKVKRESESSTTILQSKDTKPETTTTIIRPQFNVIVKKKKKDKPKKDKSHKKEKKKKRKKE